jgi:hypothetical protein
MECERYIKSVEPSGLGMTKLSSILCTGEQNICDNLSEFEVLAAERAAVEASKELSNPFWS